MNDRYINEGSRSLTLKRVIAFLVVVGLLWLAMWRDEQRSAELARKIHVERNEIARSPYYYKEAEAAVQNKASNQNPD